MGLAAIAMRWTHGPCPALLQGLGAGRWARTGPGSLCSFSQRLLLRKAFQTPVAGLEGFGRLFCNGNDCQAQNTSDYRIQAQIAPHANVAPGLDGIPMGFPEELRSPPPSALARPLWLQLGRLQLDRLRDTKLGTGTPTLESTTSPFNASISMTGTALWPGQ